MCLRRRRDRDRVERRTFRRAAVIARRRIRQRQVMLSRDSKELFAIALGDLTGQNERNRFLAIGERSLGTICFSHTFEVGPAHFRLTIAVPGSWQLVGALGMPGTDRRPINAIDIRAIYRCYVSRMRVRGHTCSEQKYANCQSNTKQEAPK